jgi:hypothetical protein
LFESNRAVDFHSLLDGDHGGHRANFELLRDRRLGVNIDLDGNGVLLDPISDCRVYPSRSVHRFAGPTPGGARIVQEQLPLRSGSFESRLVVQIAEDRRFAHRCSSGLPGPN